jgi:hypothetical protein
MSSEIALAKLRCEAAGLVNGWGGNLRRFCQRASRLRGGRGTPAARLRGAVHLYHAGKIDTVDMMVFLTKWSTTEE